MGMFDNIHLACPECGHDIYTQSKRGPCDMSNFDQGFMPLCVAESLNSVLCDKCDNRFKVRPHKYNMVKVQLVHV